jgi:hypothetical protein
MVNKARGWEITKQTVQLAYRGRTMYRLSGTRETDVG